MMQQYRELKARDPDALLLFRMGDFYEMFGEDAERARPLLGLTLTSRDKGRTRVPMAGFPHPALDTYLAKIVQAGLRAAVCEQVEDPREAKGLVKRDVVRIVTPGTLTDDELLDPKTANYLAAIVEVGGKLGLAWVELSTGRFSLTGLLRTELVDEIARLYPAETLISELSLDAPWARGCGASRAWRSRFAPRGIFSPSRPARRSLSNSGRRRWPGLASTIAARRFRPPGHCRLTCARRKSPRWGILPGSSRFAAPTRWPSTR